MHADIHNAHIGMLTRLEMVMMLGDRPHIRAKLMNVRHAQ